MEAGPVAEVNGCEYLELAFKAAHIRDQGTREASFMLR